MNAQNAGNWQVLVNRILALFQDEATYDLYGRALLAGPNTGKREQLCVVAMYAGASAGAVEFQQFGFKPACPTAEQVKLELQGLAMTPEQLAEEGGFVISSSDDESLTDQALIFAAGGVLRDPELPLAMLMYYTMVESREQSIVFYVPCPVPCSAMLDLFKRKITMW